MSNLKGVAIEIRVVLEPMDDEARDATENASTGYLQDRIETGIASAIMGEAIPGMWMGTATVRRILAGQ